jgi:hypothetical protein
MPKEDTVDRGDLVPEVAAAVEADTAAADKVVADAKVADDAAAVAAEAKVAADAKPDDKPAEELKADDDKGHMIPKNRFDQAVGKERGRADTAEAELQKYRTREQQTQEAENFEESQAKVTAMLKDHSSLLADGDLDKASEVMGDVLQLRDDMQSARMARQADNARSSAKNEIQYDTTVERLEAAYPEINPDSETFDQDAVRKVQLMVSGIMQNEGKSPAVALMEATEILLKPQKEAGLREQPSEEATEAGLRRTQDQIDKNIKASDAQPPLTNEVGADHDKTGGVMDSETVSAMSWEEFVKVPEDELAKIRGDFIN